MIDTPRIVTSTRQLMAYVHVTVPREEIRTVMGPGIDEVKAALTAQDIAATGPWFTHHLKMDPKVFDFEICVPVGKRVNAVGRVKPGEMPSVKVARTVYRGNYEGLGAAWGEFEAWIKAQGLKPGPDLWEVYITDPSTNPDPATWQTELNKPLA
jgi:effector-binding domain-containing protein